MGDIQLIYISFTLIIACMRSLRGRGRTNTNSAGPTAGVGELAMRCASGVRSSPGMCRSTLHHGVSVPRGPAGTAACRTTAARSAAARRDLSPLSTPRVAPAALRAERRGARRGQEARGAAPRRADGRTRSAGASSVEQARSLRSRARGRVVPHLRVWKVGLKVLGSDGRGRRRRRGVKARDT